MSSNAGAICAMVDRKELSVKLSSKCCRISEPNDSLQVCTATRMYFNLKSNEFAMYGDDSISELEIVGSSTGFGIF